MKHCFFLFAAIIFLFCWGKGNDKYSFEEERHNDDTCNGVALTYAQDMLHFLITKYGKPKVLVGLWFIDNKFQNIIASQKIDTSTILYCSIEQQFQQKNIQDESLIVEINSQLSKMPPATRSQIFKSLEQWLKNDILLSSVLNGNLNEEVFFEQLIYQIPETKDILTAYLKSPDQYWGSLDANQSCKLYYDVNLYLINLKPEERLIFFKKYFDEACDISIKSIQPSVPTN